MSKEYKFTKIDSLENSPSLNFNLSDDQKVDISNLLECLMEKYSRPGFVDYHTGVSDGLNHAYKIINGITDDFMSGIEKSK